MLFPREPPSQYFDKFTNEALQTPSFRVSYGGFLTYVGMIDEILAVHDEFSLQLFSSPGG